MSRPVGVRVQGPGPRTLNFGPEIWGLSVLSAVLYALSFPNFNLAWLAWVALVPLTFVSTHSAPGRAFRVGWFAGTLAYSVILYWIVVTFLAAHQSIFLAVVCLILLSAYLGLFWGAWTWFLAKTMGRSLELKIPSFVYVVAAAAAWVALEYLRTHLFSGFPWALLGDSQWRRLYLIQIASITSVYGVSFLVVLMNVANAHTLQKWNRAPIWSIVIVLACVIGGANRLRLYNHEPAKPLYKVALLQGDIDQYAKWDAHYVNGIQKAHEELASLATLEKPALIIWPETSVPGYLLQEPSLRAWLTGVIQKTGTHHIVGAPSKDGSAAYNAAFSINSKGEIVGEYDKQHLVPFGEIVPWANVLSRWVRVLNDLGGFTSGQRSSVLPSPLGKLGVNICYEALFPNLVRRSALNGAEFIVNLTNDGWYMHTSAPYQHFIPNVFRAVENNRWLMRADNTGISAIVDPTGRVKASTPIFVPTLITGTVSSQQATTFYTRHGDVFAWGCLGFCIVILMRAILRRRR